jgi:hypothetical protein
MTVPVRLPGPGEQLELGTATRLFETGVESTIEGGIAHGFAVAADGQRFLMNTLAEQPASSATLILNRNHR